MTEHLVDANTPAMRRLLTRVAIGHLSVDDAVDTMAGWPAQDGDHAEHCDLLEAAWGIIANAGGWVHGGYREASSPGWLEAAQRWRDDYHELLRAHCATGAEPRPAAAPRPKAGDRTVDGGMTGVLRCCDTCDGDGLLFQPDPGQQPPPVAPSEPPGPAGEGYTEDWATFYDRIGAVPCDDVLRFPRGEAAASEGVEDPDLGDGYTASLPEPRPSPGTTAHTARARAGAHERLRERLGFSDPARIVLTPDQARALLTEHDQALADVREHERTRTLGGPITGRRIPDNEWSNVAVGGPVQRDYTGTTQEGT